MCVARVWLAVGACCAAAAPTRALAMQDSKRFARDRSLHARSMADIDAAREAREATYRPTLMFRPNAILAVDVPAGSAAVPTINDIGVLQL